MKSKNLDRAFILSCISGIFLILLQFLRWELFPIFSFFEIFIELFIICLFIISIIFSIINFFRTQKKPSTKAVSPLLVNIFTLLIVIFFPFNAILLNFDFFINKNVREEVIHLIENDKIKSNIKGSRGIIHLPDKYNNLSKGGGDILISKTEEGTAEFFFTYRGVLDNFSGFAYCPDSSKSCVGQFVNKEDLLESSKMDSHWYWIASH